MPQPESASIVIVGGGAVGCGVAYSLACAGETDVLVLEQATSLAATTTPQAAGLVGQVRTLITPHGQPLAMFIKRPCLLGRRGNLR